MVKRFKRISIILTSFVFMIMFVQNASAYENYNIGDKVTFGGIGGHVIEDSDSSDSTVKIFVDGWNKTKEEWDAWWDKYAEDNGYPDVFSAFNDFDFSKFITDKTNFNSKVATLTDLDKFIDISFIPKEYWLNDSTEPVYKDEGGKYKFSYNIVNYNNPGLSTYVWDVPIYTLTDTRNLPIWMFTDSINFFGTRYFDAEDSYHILKSEKLSDDPYSMATKNYYLYGIMYKDDIFNTDYLSIDMLGYCKNGELSWSWQRGESKHCGPLNEEEDTNADIKLSLGHNSELTHNNFGNVEYSIMYPYIIVISKTNIDSVERTTKTYSYDNSVSEIIKYKNKLDGNEDDNPIIGNICLPMEGGSFIVHYNSNGGNEIEDMRIVIAESPDSYTDIPSATREGYNFMGWYYDSKFENKFEGNKTNKINPIEDYDENNCHIGYKDVTLYAKWEKRLTSDNITVLTNGSELDNVAELKISDVEKIEELKSRFAGILSTFKAYEIDLLDNNGEKVQPTGKIKLLIPIPTDINKEKLAVYRVTSDNYVVYESIVNGDYVEIETDHFSTYLIGEKLKVNNPNTGDNILLYIGFGLVLVVGSLILVKKIKESK